MILATIEFPNGSRINLDENGRWTGDDEIVVNYANHYRRAPGHQPDPIRALAAEIVAHIGGRVVFVIEQHNPNPPGVDY
jgi:hypothetical protein